MDSSEDNDVSIPDELVDKLLNFQQDFEKMSEVLSPLSTININSTDHQVILLGIYLNKYKRYSKISLRETSSFYSKFII